ncbi:MAG: lysophospholipid acyltransferase family protein [Ketobacteraceae bacterium]|nr:lysophospholipid acyltransferase family protein [Ketobacteraceae bacterium]
MSHFFPHFEASGAAKTAAQWLYMPFKWCIYLPLMVLSTNMAALFLIMYCLLGGRSLVRIVPVLWARFNAHIVPATVSVTGRENINPAQSYVVVANHQSHFDIFAIYGWLGIDLRWVMKKELRSIPVFGYACEVMGQIIIDRSNPEQAMHSIAAAKDRISNGTSIMFFPEGTRSLDGNMLPFKSGAFRFARELGLPILPVTIRGSRNILPSKTIRLQPGHMELVVHPPIAVAETSEVAELSRQARDAIESGLH